MSEWTHTKTKPKNNLTKPERDALVVGVMSWCRKLARDHVKSVKGAGDHVEVEDMEGDAFAAAVEASQHYNPANAAKSTFLTFVTPWVRHRLLAVTDPRNKVKASRIDRPELIGDLGAHDEHGGYDIDEPVDYAASPLANSLLASLPPRSSSIVRKIFMEGLSPGRVAAQLGIGVKDVHLELFNATKKIVSQLDASKATESAGIFSADQLIGFARDCGEKSIEEINAAIETYKRESATRSHKGK